MKKLLNSSLALCGAILLLAAHAPAQKRTPRPAPQPVVTATPPSPAPNATPGPSPTPQPTPAAEPFDGASVERMAAQCVRLETEAGTIEMKMLPEAAPETVRNFLNLVATGAYDTTTFSRVVRNFVVQGGNLSTRETLTPALAARSRRTIPDEPSQVKHVRGIVSMARADSPHSATTHFFILVSDAGYLNGTFAAFARVTKGMEVADAINKAAIEGDRPLTPVRLGSAVVFACPVTQPTPAQ
jgi:peptidyl-prolyl cis-trans isomerase B (cyclophilin B)